MPRKLTLLSVRAGLIFLFVVAVLPRTGSAQPTTFQQTQIRVDRNQYRVGDPITICYSIPPGQTPIAIVQTTPDNRTVPILQGIDDGTGGCFQSTVVPPVGNECLRIIVYAPGSLPQLGQGVVIGDRTVCYKVTEALGPLPPPSTGVSISTDRSRYIAGDPIQVCYNVAQSGFVVVTDILADGTSQTIFSGPTGAGTTCVPNIVAGPAIGNECMRVDAYLSQGASFVGGSQKCFIVSPRVQPQPVPPLVFGGGGASLRLTRQQFRPGEVVQVCYAVPGQGQVAISLSNPSGAVFQVAGGSDNGTGGCTNVVATQPFGRWCFNLTWTSTSITERQQTQTAQACYQVIGQG